MKWIVLLTSVIAAITTLSIEPVYASDLADVVRARANARAGGGTSGHDAWVLKRHGKLSGSRTRSNRAAHSRRAAKKRALLAAKKKKAAAAKRKAYLAAKKKKEAQRRALIAAKKRKAAQKRALIAAKKKAAAKKRAQLAAKKKLQAEKLAIAQQASETETAPDVANAQEPATSEKTESSFVSAPSTSALITSQEIEVNPAAKSTPTLGRKIANAEKTEDPIKTLEQPRAPETISGTAQGDADQTGGCKKFLPAIGLTVSVGC